MWGYVPGSEWLTTAGQAELWSQKEFVLLSRGSPFTQVFKVQAQRTISPYLLTIVSPLVRTSRGQ